MSLKVLVSGAGGKMGVEVLKAVHEAPDMTLVGAVDPAWVGSDVGELMGTGSVGVTVKASLADAVQASPEATHVVDFTSPAVVYDNVQAALDLKRRVVFGTTGLSEAQLASIDRRARAQGTGVIHAPNFAIGAVLMMRFAAEAAKYFDGAEIIELHHDHKKDAPSGTAVKTAELMHEARDEAFALPDREDWVEMAGARGHAMDGIRVHSVRLPGLVAHQEVILGLPGQTLTLRHDSFDRVSFMPGVLLALRKVNEVEGLVYGLEHVMF